MDSFTKVLRIGTVNTGNGRRASIHCKVKFTDRRLSFTGVIGALPSGNALGSSGQISWEFAHRNARDNDARYNSLIAPSDIMFTSSWDTELWYDFLDAWKRWHMNDTRAGSQVQEDYLRTHPISQADYVYPKSHYEVALQVLTDAGLNPDADGYVYGSAWKFEQIPQNVLNFLYTLPDADKLPAWI